MSGMPMRPRKKRKKAGHNGSTFDSFLEQEGIREEVEAVAIKRVLAWQRTKRGSSVPIGQVRRRNGFS
jgi:hypothetical protein